LEKRLGGEDDFATEMQPDDEPASKANITEFEDVLRDFPNVEDNKVEELYILADGSPRRFERLLAKNERETEKQTRDEERSNEDEADSVELNSFRRERKLGKKPGASTDVSGSRRAKPVKKATTDDEYIDQYNAGDLAFDELPESAQKRVE
ncbi:hypothetical protein LCGC14_2108460, partial [marine sediment metagenome]